jgi:hypothetical protein
MLRAGLLIAVGLAERQQVVGCVSATVHPADTVVDDGCQGVARRLLTERIATELRCSDLSPSAGRATGSEAAVRYTSGMVKITPAQLVGRWRECTTAIDARPHNCSSQSTASCLFVTRYASLSSSASATRRHQYSSTSGSHAKAWL